MKSLDSYKSENQALFAGCSKNVKTMLSRIDTGVLYPPFLGKLICALNELEARGYHFWVTQGLRTWAEQDALYAKGRRGIVGEGIVTKVQGGASAHNYGIAADAAFDLDIKKAGLQPSWDKAWMKIWADAGIAAGLDAGFYWKNFVDGPHVQLDIRKHGISPRVQLQAEYKRGGLVAVYAYLDKFAF